MGRLFALGTLEAEMTYQERIAAGYEPKWGVYDDSNGTWWTTDGWRAKPAAGTRSSPRDAWNYQAQQTRPRRYWVRTKSKPATEPLGQIANEAYQEPGGRDESWEKAAQAVVAEIAKRLRLEGLYANAKDVERVAK